MYTFCRIGLLCLIALLLAGAIPATQDWTIQADKARIRFEIGALVGKTEGKFGGLTGMIRFAPGQLQQAVFDVSIQAATIFTDNGRRDKHLRSADFFDVEKFPLIRFQSSSITRNGDQYLVTGTLQLKDVRKTVAFPFHFQDNGREGLFKGSFRINRLDFGVGEKSMLVDDEVTLLIEVPVTH